MAEGGTLELLEREEQLAQLRARLQDVRRSSHGHVVLLRGEAGIGKTTLVRRFCDEALPSAQVVWCACDPLFTPRPLGPLLLAVDGRGAAVEHLVAPEALPHEVVAALAHELRARRPSILVIEDVHWADEATFDVLRLLARRVETIPALVLVSYRDDELALVRPLQVVLGELAGGRSTTRINLARLSPAAVSELSATHAVDAAELFRTTGGNPFFVGEVLAADGADIPETLRDAALARATRLSPDGRALLEAAAIVPSHAPLKLLEAIAGGAVASLEECLACGMLVIDGAGVRFRHELSRLAIEEAIAPNRKAELHRLALAALAEPSVGTPDVAQLAHHAEAAGEAAAVLRFAPVAAVAAASLGSHREAAAQYARTLRFGGRLPPSERARLLERRADACYLTDDYDGGISALEDALECHRQSGDELGEGRVLARLSEFLWCPGRTAEAEATARAAVEVLERLPPSRELARAYAELASRRAGAAAADEGIAWGRRALELAERLADNETAVHALATIGSCEPPEDGLQTLNVSLERAEQLESSEHVGRAHVLRTGVAVGDRRQSVATQAVTAGLAFCGDRGLELFRLYLLVSRAQLELDQGRWSDAAASATAVVRTPRTSTTPRILALVVLGRVRARRGDPEWLAALDEAWALAEPTGELLRFGPVAAAKAESAWLAGDPRGVDEATVGSGTLEFARERGWGWLVGELSDWRRRAGLESAGSEGAAEPYALQLEGEYAAAAEQWRELGFPYESALALLSSDDEELLRRALDELQLLGARPAAALALSRLRKLGARQLPRGPRPATRSNAAGLSPRQMEVLRLVADGLRNKEIADRLVLSERTVEHHVAAVLRGLGVRTRTEATADAVRRGLVDEVG